MENNNMSRLERFEKGLYWLETHPDTWEFNKEGDMVIIDPNVPDWIKQVAEDQNESMRYTRECIAWWNTNAEDED